MTLRPYVRFYDGKDLLLEADYAVIPTPTKGQTWVLCNAQNGAQDIYEVGEVEISQPYRYYSATDTIPERREALAGWAIVVQLYRIAG